MHNTLKEKLAQGKRPLGTFVGTGSAAVVECLGLSIRRQRQMCIRDRTSTVP